MYFNCNYYGKIVFGEYIVEDMTQNTVACFLHTRFFNDWLVNQSFHVS